MNDGNEASENLTGYVNINAAPFASNAQIGTVSAGG